jgi:hypothetical protein
MSRAVAFAAGAITAAVGLWLSYRVWEIYRNPADEFAEVR